MPEQAMQLAVPAPEGEPQARSAAKPERASLAHDACATVVTIFMGGLVVAAGAKVAGLPRALEIAVLVAVAAVVPGFMGGLYVRMWRGSTLSGTGTVVGSGLRVHPIVDTGLTIAGLWFWAVTLFAFATYLIDTGAFTAGLPARTPAGVARDSLAYYEVFDLYAWHGLDVLPFVKATDTLNLSEPLRGHGQLIGWLLLAYKGLVLAPLLAVAHAGWLRRHVSAAAVRAAPAVARPGTSASRARAARARRST